MQARTARSRQRLRHIDAQCYDGKTEPETDAGRIFERVAEVIESVAVVEERGDPEVTRQIADDFHGARDEILAAILDRSHVLYAGDTGRHDDGPRGRRPANRIHRRELIVCKAAHTV